MSDNGIPIIGEKRYNEHQLATAFRKLHLEPNDIVVVRGEFNPTDIAVMFQNFNCGHNPMKCQGHRVIVAPEGIESVSRMMLEELLQRQKSELTDVTGEPV